MFGFQIVAKEKLEGMSSNTLTVLANTEEDNSSWIEDLKKVIQDLSIKIPDNEFLPPNASIPNNPDVLDEIDKLKRIDRPKQNDVINEEIKEP